MTSLKYVLALSTLHIIHFGSNQTEQIKEIQIEIVDSELHGYQEEQQWTNCLQLSSKVSSFSNP